MGRTQKNDQRSERTGAVSAHGGIQPYRRCRVHQQIEITEKENYTVKRTGHGILQLHGKQCKKGGQLRYVPFIYEQLVSVDESHRERVIKAIIHRVKTAPHKKTEINKKAGRQNCRRDILFRNTVF